MNKFINDIFQTKYRRIISAVFFLLIIFGLHFLIPAEDNLFILIMGIAFIIFYEIVLIRYRQPVERAAEMAEDLVYGKYKKRITESAKNSELSRLYQSLNHLAANLEIMTKSYQTQEDRLATLIENIGSGLIFIDNHGRINLLNKTYRETFQVKTNNWSDKTYYEVIPYQEVIDIIDETFSTERRLSKQVLLPVHIERKHFDVSCAPILAQQKRLQGIVVVFHDITELKKLEKMRKDFVANVSHELKTPVTSLIGFTETLLDGAMDDSELKTKFLNIILNESKRLQSLIQDLLELSKIEQEHFTIKWQSVSLKDIVEETLIILKEKANQKSIILEVLPSSNGLALGDPYRIQQMIINLVTNAIAYTPSGGHVWIQVKDKGNDYIELMVKDTGIGISEDQIPRIFERFYRVDKGRSRNQGGTGLGLAIVKHLVEAHNGRIDVSSEIGKGTTFAITFNKAKEKGDVIH
ncbi:two-component system phosphate regulon sensor histidine kinase PhoR [Scopulibacillus daqui]|uniref:histidine kinase n=1 Tax=Scopulibacillus daqui TaxID=1469162 RepID=A0ABS2PXN8_9BACL|nr:ATP-binding protein [Scopulibacillus daqui]MBM7644787.1 two-component system phosphate regulon sensor histidine kinase PhoR [Scopulibacillus daqui]